MVNIGYSDFLKIIAFLAAAIAMGLGAVGPSFGVGYLGSKGAEAMSVRKEARGAIMRTMLVGMAIAESTGIYALVVAVLLLFVIIK